MKLNLPTIVSHPPSRGTSLCRVPIPKNIFSSIKSELDKKTKEIPFEKVIHLQV